jgi:hypothetical protein
LRGPEIRALHAWQNLQGGRSPYVFTSLRGGPLVERSVHAIVQGAGAAAGLPFAAIHTCCATHAGLSSPKTVKIRAPSRATLATARSIRRSDIPIDQFDGPIYRMAPGRFEGF